MNRGFLELWISGLFESTGTRLSLISILTLRSEVERCTFIPTHSSIRFRLEINAIPVSPNAKQSVSNSEECVRALDCCPNQEGQVKQPTTRGHAISKSEHAVISAPISERNDDGARSLFRSSFPAGIRAPCSRNCCIDIIFSAGG